MTQAILVLTPSVLAVAVFVYGFILWTFRISATNWNDVVIDYSFVGLKNWTRLFTHRRFRIDMRNLVLYAASFMTQSIFLGFLLASLLDQHVKGENFFRTVYVLPFAVSGIVTGVAWKWLMNPSTGLNLLFEKIGLDFLKNQWFASKYGILAVTIAASWQGTGYIVALYLAGLRGVSQDVREAAAIDGANTWQLYRHVIIPLLMPVTWTAIVLTGMNSIRVFDLVSSLSGPGPDFADDTLAYWMFENTFTANRFAMGAALAAFMIILSAFLVGPYLASMRFELER